MEPGHDESLFDMNMNSSMQNHILSVSKWTKFISIVFFICILLFVLAILVSGSDIIQAYSSILAFSDPDAWNTIVIVLVIFGVYFLTWLFYLFRTSLMLRRGLQSRDTAKLAEGFKSLRIFFVLSFIFSLLSILSTINTLLKF